MVTHGETILIIGQLPLLFRQFIIEVYGCFTVCIVLGAEHMFGAEIKGWCSLLLIRCNVKDDDIVASPDHSIFN